MKVKKVFRNMFIIVVMVCCVALYAYSQTTLTNKDIERIKGKQSGNLPGYSQPGDNMPPPEPGVSGSTGTSGALVVKKLLPFKEWEEEYAEYFQSHYNDSSLDLKPKMIALHYSGTSDFNTLWWTYVNGNNYPAGSEKKFGHLSTHFVVDKDGTIYQLMPLERRARGTYGVNHVAISIEIIGRNENELLSNHKQMKVAFALIKWLAKKYKISASGILAHTEIAQGKSTVPDYTDYADKKSPNKYPAGSNLRGPGKTYMFKLRYYLYEPR
jgi:hypothetical protein